MQLAFSGTIWYWRGPAPWHFVTVPQAHNADLRAMAASVTYGWGVIPATVQTGATVWKTSLIPKDGCYLVPIKADVRRAEALAEGDTVALLLDIRPL
jgi:hypothetical protein